MKNNPTGGDIVALVLRALEFRGADLSLYGQKTCDEIAAEIPALSAPRKSKKNRRVVIGTGHPYFISPKDEGSAFNGLRLFTSDCGPEPVNIKTGGVGGWNKVRVVLEVLK